MIWLVVVEGVLVVVLGLFVVALAHSYAGLAARLEPRREPTTVDPGVVDVPRPRPVRVEEAGVLHVAGVSPSGEPVVLPIAGVEHDTLLAFLTSTCRSCEHLWRELRDAAGHVVPDRLRLVIVAKGPERESPAAIASLAPEASELVMSSDAWSAFAVPGSPYFVLVDGETGAIAGEGTALSWSQVLDLMAVSTGDASIGPAAARDRHKPQRDRQREEEVDLLLMEAGIFPGDPTLYPSLGDVHDAT